MTTQLQNEYIFVCLVKVHRILFRQIGANEIADIKYANRI